MEVQEAEAAVRGVTGIVLHGQALKVDWARGDKEWSAAGDRFRGNPVGRPPPPSTGNAITASEQVNAIRAIEKKLEQMEKG
jgi:hypothetical protein